MNIKGKVIILTGVARVGEVVAKALHERGAHLVLTYHSSPPKSEVQFDGSGKSESKIIQIKADLSAEADVRRLVAETKSELGGLHALVHMAAIYKRTPWDTLCEKDWNSNMDIIGKSTFLLGKLVGDELLKNDGDDVIQEGRAVGKVKGKIITISDWSVLARPYKDYLPYNAAKGAVIALTKSLAKELAPYVLVNSIAPGPILPPPDLSEEENREVLSATPLGRWGGAEEIAKVVVYLLEADFVTGQVLAVDGGRTIG